MNDIYKKTRKAIFLDRDGVINKLVVKDGVGRAPYLLKELFVFEGVKEACQNFKDLGFLNIVVTNQPDVTRGWVALESVELINTRMKEILLIDDIKICFHVNEDNCHCRKPKAGMLLDSALEWQVDLKQSFMIGDRYGDIAAGMTAGCTTILIGPGDKQGSHPSPHYNVDSLIEGASLIRSLATNRGS